MSKERVTRLLDRLDRNLLVFIPVSLLNDGTLPTATLYNYDLNLGIERVLKNWLCVMIYENLMLCSLKMIKCWVFTVLKNAFEIPHCHS